MRARFLIPAAEPVTLARISRGLTSSQNKESWPDKNFELIDPASGKKSRLPVRAGTIGPAVLDIAALNKDHGVFTFDPGFMATASTESKITYIDGDAGVLMYRGYPIEQLAEKSSFTEVAYLLLYGELPTAAATRRNSRRQHRSSHDDQRVAAALLRRLSPQRAPDGDGVGGRRLDVGVLPRHDGHL